ncbi:hypothetical protein J057_00839 [Marinobacter nanhaiticus D15-8W]|uniref:Transposase n=1 Tax=Marinobacter nanhaiticus D15-8W TaxID=626887 RepID=N6X169_9GAMM|nr:hypothetical protein J057_00839 [Marinobacter nanhaiticus D15-8W]
MIQFYTCQGELDAGSEAATPYAGRSDGVEHKVARLKRENERLKQENDILKTAAAYVAKSLE